MTEQNAIVYRDSLDEIIPDHLHGFFVSWPPPPSSETHLRVLHGSNAGILAVDTATGNVVGFVTAITDGVLTAYTPLVGSATRVSGSGYQFGTHAADADEAPRPLRH